MQYVALVACSVAASSHGKLHDKIAREIYRCEMSLKVALFCHPGWVGWGRRDEASGLESVLRVFSILWHSWFGDRKSLQCV